MNKETETPKPADVAGRLDGLVGRLIGPSYRICTDRYLGYEVQVWRWSWPFWIQLDFSNTHLSIESARKQIAAYEAKRTWRSKVVEKVTPNAALSSGPRKD